MTDAPSLHLYVHLPFCAHKCHYCDFNSHVRAAPDWNAYGDTLLRELDAWLTAPAFAGRRITTVFFGGGTPSLAPPSLFADLLDHLDARSLLAEDAEITMEANPGSSEAARFADCRRAGVNRLSIGVQSLDADELRWLERIHSPAEALEAFEAARRAGFANVNLDLMHSLPAQPLDRWLATLDDAIALGPEHLSC
ncbi:MAG: coproporphyrinogen-III oxidase family protein, partial [Mariprofundaceae bacterium]